MTGQYTHQQLSPNGIFESLRTLDRSGTSVSSRNQIVEIMATSGVADPVVAFDSLVEHGLFQPIGSGYGLSNFGARSTILLEALNGGDIGQAYRRLRAVDPSVQSYELVREGMTDSFLENVRERPGFTRLYLCSPWIRLSGRNLESLRDALRQAEARGDRPELLVMTRPEKGGKPPAGIGPLTELGATVFLNHRLHTKLYIREPGTKGTYAMAIVGSENLTLSTHLELGIRVNADSSMISNLIRYFWAMSNDSTEVGRQR